MKRTTKRATMRRKQWLEMQCLMRGIPVMMLAEAVASWALSHEDGWLDEMVDADTGDSIRITGEGGQ